MWAEIPTLRSKFAPDWGRIPLSIVQGSYLVLDVKQALGPLSKALGGKHSFDIRGSDFPIVPPKICAGFGGGFGGSTDRRSKRNNLSERGLAERRRLTRLGGFVYHCV